MKNLTLLFFLLLSTSGVYAQQSKKGFEYTGTKARFSMFGKSKMFSEGIKPLPYTIYWNKKKNTIQVNAGAKDKWYTIELTGTDTIQGNITIIGRLEGTEKETDFTKITKGRYEIRFMVDKVSIKVGDARLEEYLLDGAAVWADQPVKQE